MKDLVKTTRPKTTKEIVGNGKLIQGLKKDIGESKGGGFLISGANGIGKTLSIELIIEELGLDAIFINTSNTSNIENMDVTGTSIKSFFNSAAKGKIFILDNISTFAAGVTVILTKKIKNSKFPIVIICNDAYPLRTIEKSCKSYKFKRPTPIQITKFLIKNKIIKPEPKKERIEDLISNCRNDIRYLLNTLGVRNTRATKDAGDLTIFETSKKIFDTRKTLQERLSAFYEDTFLIPLMVNENIVSKKKGDYSNALDTFALADIYAQSSRPGVGSMSLSKYQGILIIKAINQSPHRPGFPNYSKLLGKESSMRKRNEEFKRLPYENFRTEYMTHVLPTLVSLISQKEHKQAHEIMKTYGLTKDLIYDVLCKCWLGSPDAIKVPTKEKGAFTRYLNKPKALA